MQSDKKEAVAVVQTATGMRAFEEDDLPKIGGFLLYGQSFGDLLCMSPMIDEAVRILGKKLDVWTRRPEIFQYHPQVRAHFPEPEALQAYLNQGNLLFVSPVGTTQERFEIHFVDHSGRGIVELPLDAKKIIFHSCEEAKNSIAKRLEKIPKHLKKVIIHPGQNQPIRTWPESRWAELTRDLLAQDHVVISVGKDMVYEAGPNSFPKTAFRLGMNHPNFIDLTNQLSLHELYELILVSDLVVTSDSGVLHVANATEVPIVAIFTDVDPAARTRFDSEGKLGYKTTVVCAPCEYQFCASRFGFQNDVCRLADSEPMKCLPSAQAVFQACQKHL